MARAGGQNLIMNIGAEAKRKKRLDSFGFIMLADAIFMAHAIQAWHNYAWTDIIYYFCSDVNRAISNGAHYTAQGYFGQHHQGPQGPALACRTKVVPLSLIFQGPCRLVPPEGLIQFGYAFPLACCCCSRLKNPSP